jgi:hypothetical protein
MFNPEAGSISSIAVSPDGKRVVFVALMGMFIFSVKLQWLPVSVALKQLPELRRKN